MSKDANLIDTSKEREFDNALHIMEVQGGSFVKALANCFYAADAKNKAILRESFKEYFDSYEERFRQHVAGRKS